MTNTELDIDAERASFERHIGTDRHTAHWTSPGPTERHPSGDYFYSHVQIAWLAWLAARRATIQPTACQHARQSTTALGAMTGTGWTCKDCGALISDKPAPDKDRTAVAPADAVRDAAMPTDISKRLRECANGPMANQDHAKLMLTAADECERFYGGMVAWKETARAKDRFNVAAYAHKIAEARNAALEEAAKVCDEKFEARSDTGHSREASTARSLRDSMRAMKTTPEEPAK